MPVTDESERIHPPRDAKCQGKRWWVLTSSGFWREVQIIRYNPPRRELSAEKDARRARFTMGLEMISAAEFHGSWTCHARGEPEISAIIDSDTVVWSHTPVGGS